MSYRNPDAQRAYQRAWVKKRARTTRLCMLCAEERVTAYHCARHASRIRERQRALGPRRNARRRERRAFRRARLALLRARAAALCTGERDDR